MQTIWDVLGIAPTKETRLIKRAYAALLKSCQPEDDPEGFRRLNHAYQSAMDQAQAGNRVVVHMPPPPRPDTAGPAWNPPRAWDPPVDPLRRERGPLPDTAPQQTSAETGPDPSAEGRDLLSTLRERGEPAALAELERLLQQPHYQALLAKDELQRTLLNGLPMQEPLPGAFLSALAERFGWHDGRHPYQRSFARQFQVVRRARDEYLARRMLEDMAARKLRQFPWYQRLMYQRAARLLLGRTRRLVYMFFSFDLLLRRYIGLVTKRIHQAYPLASDAIYDATALKWSRMQLLNTNIRVKRASNWLLVLNVIFGLALGFIANMVFADSPLLRDNPVKFIFLGEIAGLLLITVPLHALCMALLFLWLDIPRFTATPRRRQAAFWGAAALLYLITAFLPSLYALYFWGLSVVLLLIVVPDVYALGVRMFVGSLIWEAFNQVLMPGFESSHAKGWMQLDSPFLGWIYMIGLAQLRLKLFPNTNRDSARWIYVGMVFGTTLLLMVIASAVESLLHH